MTTNREPLRRICHTAAQNDDDALRREARSHLARSGELQLVAELYEKLRTSAFGWWSFGFLRETWPASARFAWLIDRPDLRQQVASALTGLPRNTARQQTAEFQASLVESVIATGDVSDEAYELSFSAGDVAVYGPAADIWAEFRNRFPWEEDTHAHRRFVAWVLRALLADRSNLDGEIGRRPILSACDLRAAIDAKVWHGRLPVEVRAAIDAARLKLERTRPREPFHARNELAIATPEILATHLPLVELSPILAAADAVLGFAVDARVMPAELAASWSITPPFSDAPPPPQSVPTISLRRVG